jgi:hypothetical protein
MSLFPPSDLILYLLFISHKHTKHTHPSTSSHNTHTQSVLNSVRTYLVSDIIHENHRVNNSAGHHELHDAVCYRLQLVGLTPHKALLLGGADKLPYL